MKISDFLGYGEMNAKTSRELCELLDITPVELRQLIHSARVSGEVILSSCSSEHPGYYLPETDEEIERYIRQMKSRIKEIWKATQSAIRALNKSV